MTTLADTIRRLDGECVRAPWGHWPEAGDVEVFACEWDDMDHPTLAPGTTSTEYVVISAVRPRNGWGGEIYEPDEPTAALIVALRNHADEIADALESVERVRDYLALDMHDGECYSLRPHFTAIGPEVCNCTHGNVRRALDGE